MLQYACRTVSSLNTSQDALFRALLRDSFAMTSKYLRKLIRELGLRTDIFRYLRLRLAAKLFASVGWHLDFCGCG